MDEKKKHLEYVYLTAEEYPKLCELLGPDGAADWIEELNDYLGQSEKNRRKYDSHYHTIRAWARRAGKKTKNEGRETKDAEVLIDLITEHASMPAGIASGLAAKFRTMAEKMRTNWPRLHVQIRQDREAAETQIRKNL
jgi:hypothetical protein